ncbi:OmpP1/FadL family transporter [Flavobacterium psychrotolerans]|uniref:Transporter n=1 Tax=Flavobacterium psychrotolerans TaxID=2169410 RepID=A0A2U1JQF6_9FLAO|nr:outer membrane protein transport protein [Flavobacterium psychrotolerans]PWA07407.1 transporter [Flavobacterium psychrotolerans]
MKKYITIIIAGLSFSAVHSQGIADALRFSQDNLNGTARFSAMSGAFGALGGDFSSINVNPAGSAIFSNNQVGFTLSSYNAKNKSEYFGTKNSENNISFDLNQAGAVFVFNNANLKNEWKKITIGVNYENANNFDNSIFVAGTNPKNSIADYFLSYANPTVNQGGIYLGTLKDYYYEELNYQDQQAYLGYYGKIIIPVDPTNLNNDSYVSNVPAGGNYYQDNYIESSGYNGKLAFNAATQYKDKLYFGLNLNSHFTDYKHSTSFYESNTNSTNSQVRSLQFDNDLHTYGSGFSLQLGAIAKVTKELRFGLAYESPTWYWLNDQLLQTLYSTVNPSTTSSTVDSNFIMTSAPYTLQTPGKWTGSLAYIFGKSGLISMDYGLKDYSNTKFTPKNEFQNANQDLSNRLTTAAELRIGAEYRIKQWSLRGGFRNEQSPYKDGKTIGDLTGYSGGFGYNFGATKLDLAYSFSQRSTQQGFFSQGFMDSATVKTNRNNFSMTLLFEL